MTSPDPGELWSATELVDFFTCAHRAALERRAAAGALERPAPSGEAAVVLRRGLERERAELSGLAAAGRTVTTIPRAMLPGELTAAAAATRAALAAGADVVANAALAVGAFRGVVDLLERVPGSAFGPFAYEAVDVRLAMRSAPGAIVAACAYAEALATICGVPFESTRFHIANGDGSRSTFRASDVSAFYRRLRARFSADRALVAPTRPDPIGACALCRWNAACAAERTASDDVTLVAGIRRDQVRALRETGIPTVAALAAAPARPPGLTAAAWERLRDQAALQAEARRTGRHRYRLLPREPHAGLAVLPPPSSGDLAFDLEGDPFVPGGLEYLWGVAERTGGAPRFRANWAHDRGAESAAAAAFLDLVRERRAFDPAMHVFHYAPYEITALSRITLGTPYEAVFNDLLGAGVFVDLYAIVRAALRVSTPTYSIKSLELFYRGAKRSSDVADAIGSVVAYEEYLRTGRTGYLDEIEVYNRDDCFSTFELHAWLLELRAEADRLGIPELPPAPERERRAADDLDTAELQARLGGSGDGPALLAELLTYHRREKRAEWREFFARCEAGEAELLDDAKALAGLVPLDLPPVPEKLSLCYTLSFPPQRHEVRCGDTPCDPRTQSSAGTVVSVTTADDGGGRLVLKRSKQRAHAPLPTALIPATGAYDDAQREALRRLARAADDERAGPAWALLERRPPRLRSGRALPPAAATDPLVLAQTIDELDGSALVVQGPPGTGKTWIAARAIVALLASGRRVGVSAGTHKAINNLLAEIERVAAADGVALHGAKKSDPKRPETLYAADGGGGIIDVGDANAFPQPGIPLIAGTPALFARAEMAGSVDVLVVDEAGQLALADAVAIAGAGASIVLFGDPQQLPNVTTGAHPPGAGASVLEHLLDGAATVPPDRGLFLPVSYRMHPAIVRFVSELMYDGRLTGDARCAQRRIVAPGTPYDGAGLRWLPVAHRSCASSSPAEAAAIVAALAALQGAVVIDADGTARPFESADAIVVAPYNAQVATIRAALAGAGLDAVRVGTVDKFQGQEASVVLYSMTTSSGDDVPRDVEFLFDRNRLNVAISRARALAVVVASPELLDLHPTSIEQIRLVNALARFVELASGYAAKSGSAPSANAISAASRS